jgi:hypothetical protein
MKVTVTEEHELQHATILHQAKELVEVKYLKAVKEKIDAPAVVVYDLDDPGAVSFLRSRNSGVERHRDTARANGVVPLAVCHCSSEEAADRIDCSLPESRELRAGTIREGFFPVVVFSVGRMSLRWLPVPEL